MGAKMYRKQLSEIGIEDMEIDVSSLEKAMETMQNLDDMETVLKKIRFNVHTDIRKVRVDYMKKMQELDEQLNKPKLFGRKRSPDEIIRKKKSVMKERKIKIKSYELIENMVDNYISQIEESRLYIKNHIQRKVK
ncbi:MAG: hypothetical protein A4E27_01051 [Methanobacterium sp. PtaU1.Bin242]|nr:MAG: hypothetical protein A4E27_01051 [Methanobacterium sp. PtaU1.Bin242]